MLELTVYITEDADTDFPYQAIKTLELDDTAVLALAEAIAAIRPTPLAPDAAGSDPITRDWADEQEDKAWAYLSDAAQVKHGS